MRREIFYCFLPRLRRMKVPPGIACAVSLFWLLPWSARSSDFRAFQLSPGFEENNRASYTWSNGAVLARLEPGGSASITLPNRTRVMMRLLGARSASKPQPEGQLKWTSYYYLGAASSWRSTSHFERIRYREIYPGIDLVFRTSSGQLEYSFEIGPQADLSRIKLRYRGARIDLAADGHLTIEASGERFTQERPHAFQNQNGQLRSIPCDYRLQQSGLVTVHPTGYDPRAAFVIDPSLVFSTLVGGQGSDAIHALAVDTSGNLYVTGASSSESLTGGSGPQRSSQVAFVAKLTAVGALMYSAFVGGSGGDSGQGIAVDSQGNAYVTGATASSDFPTSGGAFNRHLSGPQNAFVFKLNAAGALQYSTYLGGGTSDSGQAIAVDASNAVYVAGRTASTGFPVTAGAIQTTFGGGFADCFVSKLNAAGTALVYSTFLGGAELDICSGLAIDQTDDAYVTGTTYSANYPTRAALQGSLAGTATAFVSEINPLGSALVYSTLLGGSNIDNGNGIAVDATGAAYVAGATSSADFPLTPGAFQTGLNGLYNAFVSKISPGGSSLDFSTLIGGSGTDAATSIAVDQAGRIVVGGYTTSANFPTMGAIQASYQGSFDAFATVLNAQGTSIIFSSYFGGSGADQAFAVGAGRSGRLFLAGVTWSTNFPTLSTFDAQSVPSDGFALQVSYAPRVLIVEQDATTQVSEWLLGGSQGNVLESSIVLAATSPAGWSLSGLADFNGDGVLDLIWEYVSTGQAIVWYMGGAQGNVYQSFGWLNPGSLVGWTLIGAVDFNGDGHPDLMWQDNSTVQVAAWYMGGALGNVYQSFGWLNSAGLPGWTLVGAVDLNGDGHPDLIWQENATGQVAVWYMGGAQGNIYQSFAWLNSGALPGWRAVGMADLNGDGHPDLIWQNTTTREIVVWYMGGAQGNTYLSSAVMNIGLTGWTVKGVY
jgi:FG-GAP-like repeat/Beta-propeller repeat